MRTVLILLNFIFAALSFEVQASEVATGDHLKVSWVAPKAFGPAPEYIGLKFVLEPDWHIYWRNPGDSGTAPTFKIVSTSSTVGEIQWPIPKRIPVAHLTNIGYEHEVVFPFRVEPKDGAQSIDLSVKLEWLVCKIECVPGYATLALSRPVRSGVEWNLGEQQRLMKHWATTPLASQDTQAEIKERLTAESIKGGVRVTLSGEDDFDAFPVDLELLTPAKPVVQKSKAGSQLDFKLQAGKSLPPQFALLITVAGKSWQVNDLKVSEVSREDSFWWLIVSALLGGMILNLMPCVLPVLSIKFFSLLKTSAQRRLKEAALYTLGILTTFTLLGTGFLVLRAGGAAVGWGYQLQSPLMISALILLFFLMGLSFFGFIEFGTNVMNAAGRFKNTGSFATGVLSVFVAAPCTGPFMGAALGAAASLPAAKSILIFLALGLGLALPFLIIAAFPILLSRVPKPGAWMERFKEFLAFPLFATALWLAWVLGIQVGSAGWFYVLVLLLGMTFALWLGKSRSGLFKLTAWIFAVLVLIYAVKNLQELSPTAAQAAATEAWQRFTPEAVRLAQEEQRAVFVDFTAAWCITCQVNKKVVLQTASAQELFKKNNVLLLRADWTNQDPIITQALASFGRNSVPLYVFYPADQSKPQVLPQILTLDTVSQLFTTKEISR